LTLTPNKPPAAATRENTHESHPVVINAPNPLRPQPSPEPPKKEEIHWFLKEDGK
jgi:hypothetical protein